MCDFAVATKCDEDENKEDERFHRTSTTGGLGRGGRGQQGENGGDKEASRVGNGNEMGGGC